MTQLRKKTSATAQRSYSGPTPAAASATRKTAQPSKATFSPEVFASEAEYGNTVAALAALLDASGADERHSLAGLVAVSGEFIDLYEKRSGQW